MAEERYNLSGDDVKFLRGIIGQFKKLRINPDQLPFVPQQQLYAPDVYIALTPNGGIPAMRSGSGIGTGSFSVNVPGNAICNIYRLQYIDGVQGLYLVNTSVTVYNITSTAIAGNSFIKIERDKFGSWLSDYPVSIPPSYRSDCIGGIVYRYIWNPITQLWAFDSFQGCCECVGTGSPQPCSYIPGSLCVRLIFSDQSPITFLIGAAGDSTGPHRACWEGCATTVPGCPQSIGYSLACALDSSAGPPGTLWGFVQPFLSSPCGGLPGGCYSTSVPWGIPVVTSTTPFLMSQTPPVAIPLCNNNGSESYFLIKIIVSTPEAGNHCVGTGSTIVTSWNCVNGLCTEVIGSGGTYPSLSACQAACVFSWNCVSGECVSVSGTGGTYPTLAACQAACHSTTGTGTGTGSAGGKCCHTPSSITVTDGIVSNFTQTGISDFYTDGESIPFNYVSGQVWQASGNPTGVTMVLQCNSTNGVWTLTGNFGVGYQFTGTILSMNCSGNVITGIANVVLNNFASGGSASWTFTF